TTLRVPSSNAGAPTSLPKVPALPRIPPRPALFSLQVARFGPGDHGVWLRRSRSSRRRRALPASLDQLGRLLGLSPLIVMFLITSITMLRERTTGTLERLMTMPLSKLDLLVGYGIAFALLAELQAAVTTGFAYLVLDLTTAGSAF